MFTLFCSLFLYSSIVHNTLSGFALFISSVFSYFFSTILFAKFKENPRLFNFLLASWISVAVICAFLAGLQFFDIIGYYNISDNIIFRREGILGFYRGVGFKRDPNFAALLLVLSLPALLYLKLRVKIINSVYYFSHAMLLFGVIFTQSRMGIILYLLTLFLWHCSFDKVNIKNILKILLLGIIVVSPAVFISSGHFVEKLDERFVELADTLKNGIYAGLNEDGNITSTTARYILFTSGIEVANEKFFTGWGVGNSVEAIESASPISINNVAHNTYVEFYIIFGFSGALFLIIYLLYTWPRAINVMDVELRFARVFYVIYFLSFLFLSNVFTIVFWMPIVFVLGAIRAGSIPPAGRVTRSFTIGSNIPTFSDSQNGSMSVGNPLLKSQ
ncbi:O-antigen ligase family protein [Alcaligenaceae bacterium CGII-47]|nr:O-antigen ligase family protein [Alcaligenaceae bacterium CGII-47]